MKYFFDTEFIEQPGSIQLISIGIVADDGRTLYAESTEFDEQTADEWVKENVLQKLHWWGKDDPKMVPIARGDIRVFGDIASIREALVLFIPADEKPEFWGYFADYDWVIFCWIFGKMIDLPRHFPMYCNDIKQLMVEYGIIDKVDQAPEAEHNALGDAKWNKRQYHEVIGQKIGFKKSFAQIKKENAAIGKVNLHDTFDAKTWTEEWLKTIEKHPDIPTDEGTMIGWFANAIMAGYDHAYREMRTKQKNRVD